MKMDTQRLILLFIFGFSLLMLWEAWQKEARPKPATSAAVQPQGAAVPKAIPEPAKPGAASPAAAASTSAGIPGAAASAAQGETVRVRTDLFVAEIDTL